MLLLTESLPLHPGRLLEHPTLLQGYPPANLVLGISQLLTQPPQRRTGPRFPSEAEMALETETKAQHKIQRLSVSPRDQAQRKQLLCTRRLGARRCTVVP